MVLPIGQRLIPGDTDASLDAANGRSVTIDSDSGHWGFGGTDCTFPITANGLSGSVHGNGGSYQRGYVTELVTIADAATTSSTVKIPAGARVKGVSCRVTVKPTGTTSFGIGVSGAATRFGSSVSSDADTTNVGYGDETAYSSATALLITPNTTPSDAAGRIRVVIEYELMTAPTA
jgi:hypothetical protein